jgi:DNA-binding NtrC family response regulator
VEPGKNQVTIAQHIIGKSRHSNALRKAFDRLSGTRSPVAIIGETGVGKSLFASQLGNLNSTLQIIDPARLTDEELELRLDECRTGAVLFEDLEESSFRQQKRIAGFLSHCPADVRVIATFASKPADLHSRNKLIEELYGKVLEFETIEILPLRERPEDIPVFVRFFAPNLVIDINGLESLIRKLWHENVTELRSLIERCASTSADGVFRLPADLVEEQPEIVKAISDMLQQNEQKLESSLDGLEQQIIERTLTRFGFDLTTAAKFLGMKKEDFEQKVKRLGLSPAQTR